MMQQPYYNTMYPQPSLYPTKTIDTNNNILWVDGEVGAKAYPLYGFTRSTKYTKIQANSGTKARNTTFETRRICKKRRVARYVETNSATRTGGRNKR